MTSLTKFPTSTEIEAVELRARAMRAEFLASFFKRAFAGFRRAGAETKTSPKAPLAA